MLSAITALAGCAGGPSLTGGAPNLAVVDGTVLPTPTQADITQQDRPYYIGPFDRLVIDVFGIPELTEREVRTDASGRVSFPLAGVVEAGGMTPAALEDELERRLRAAYVRDPQVTVNLKETVSQVVTVDGQVDNPGLYPVIGRMTLMKTVATAGGLAEYADLQDVVVFRTVDNQKFAALYNLKAIRQGSYQDPEIFPSDIVIVGDSESRRLFDNALRVLPLLTTPLVLTLQN